MYITSDSYITGRRVRALVVRWPYSLWDPFPIGRAMCRLPCEDVHATIDGVDVTIDDIDVTIDEVRCVNTYVRTDYA